MTPRSRRPQINLYVPTFGKVNPDGVRRIEFRLGGKQLQEHPLSTELDDSIEVGDRLGCQMIHEGSEE